MAVAQLLLSMEPKYICHNQCTMDTSSPIVPKLSTEILLIPAILELYHKPPLKAFIEYSNSNDEFNNQNDVLVIYDPDYDQSAIQALRGHCIGKNWKSRSSSEIMGSEASLVVIYDLPKVHFEAMSRAVNQLVFVTTSNKR